MVRMTNRLPALFLGHGSPMTVISDVPERAAWVALGAALPRPKAILVVSAHWQTQGKTHVTTGAQPRTIHDFRGFPDELFAVQYPAPGSDELVARIEALLGADRVERDDSWGFDHGSWGVILPMYPAADIPMVQISLDRSLEADAHIALGRALAPLRDEGVLIVGSEWAVDFQTRINAAVTAGDHAALTRFGADDQAEVAAINSAEHYLPLLYIAGARLPGDDVGIFNDTISGALSMTSYVIGDTAPLAAIA